MDSLEEITKALKAIDHTQTRYYSPKNCPDILIEEHGANIKIHMSRALHDAWVRNTYVSGTNTSDDSRASDTT